VARDPRRRRAARNSGRGQIAGNASERPAYLAAHGVGDSHARAGRFWRDGRLCRIGTTRLRLSCSHHPDHESSSPRTRYPGRNSIPAAHLRQARLNQRAYAASYHCHHRLAQAAESISGAKEQETGFISNGRAAGGLIHRKTFLSFPLSALMTPVEIETFKTSNRSLNVKQIRQSVQMCRVQEICR